MKRAISGLRAWLLQRLSALVMLAYLVAALLRLAADPPHGHAQWLALMQAPAVALATLLAFGALLLHAWVGARDVLMDYVKPLPLRIGLMTLLALLLGGSGIAVLRALW
ncbi:MAG: succinate dehydrogenase, hydrophobic membrane anchor protein [Burkholderiales bacterium]|nr:succinate dehydrogenase, hydrophobic membrane anchor protein [Burkholderiales bacterium]